MNQHRDVPDPYNDLLKTKLNKNDRQLSDSMDLNQ